jgi:hypothetical protein
MQVATASQEGAIAPRAAPHPTRPPAGHCNRYEVLQLLTHLAGTGIAVECFCKGKQPCCAASAVWLSQACCAPALVAVGARAGAQLCTGAPQGAHDALPVQH